MIPLQIVLPMLKFSLLECQVPVDVFKGITDEDAAKVVDGLALKSADRQSSIEQIKKLYELFCKSDCTLLEVCREKWSSF
jgi:succinyl-CoA synthetase beta subunit